MRSHCRLGAAGGGGLVGCFRKSVPLEVFLNEKEI